MGSEGEFGGGVAEVMDVRAAITTAQAQPGPVFLAGWSFGANVALREAVDDDRVTALALVGLPLVRPPEEQDLPELPPLERLETFTRPVLLVSGESDKYSPAPDLRGLAERLPNATVEVVPGVGHYFSRREREAARIVGEFAERMT
jgi:pimeloyl-ACP methyl ester carboxylesterase